MLKHKPNCEENTPSNTLTLEGITFRTSGNILFQDSAESEFFLAESPMLKKLDSFLEHGMEIFMRRIGS